jgi:surfeit locus 1 family protein
MGTLVRLFLVCDEGEMKRIIFLVVFGLGGAAILISLGVWQMQRLSWKQAIMTQIEGRIR